MLQTKQILNEVYQLEQNLAKNPGHQTWIARDLSTNPPIPVIVKLLAFSPQMQWEEFKLFEREAEILKQLKHPHIPRYRDYFAIDKEAGEGLYWFGLVQDYIPGASLQNLLDRSYHFSQPQVKKIAIQILNILIYLLGKNGVNALADATDKALKSYTGVVGLVGTGADADKTTQAIVCETKKGDPPMPGIVTATEVKCPSGMEALK